MNLLRAEFEIKDLEIRSTPENDNVAKGCAIPYNSNSKQMGRFVEKFGKGSCYAAPDGVVALYQHSKMNLLGSTGNETLKLDFRDDGLFFELTLPNTTLGVDVAKLLQRRDLKGVSPGFLVEDDNWIREEKTDLITRSIVKACVFEVSLTPFPAYPETEVTLREASYLAFAEKSKVVNPVYFPLPTDEILDILKGY